MTPNPPDSDPTDRDAPSESHHHADETAASRTGSDNQPTADHPSDDDIIEERIGSSRIYPSGNSDVLTVTGEFETGDIVNVYRGVVDGATAYLRVEAVAID